MKDVCIPLSVVKDQNWGILYKVSSEKSMTNLFHDSRRIIQNEWFICLRGDDSNGHEYIQQVLDQGVKYIIYELSQTSLRPAGIQVSDTNLFLTNIASWWRKQMKSKIILITGSNGKTSTKELIYFLLSKAISGLGKEKSIIKSPKSFNNHFGVPFTLLQITPNTIFSVIEAGTNHPGEIQGLSKCASPDYGIITSIQKSHIGHFEGAREIAHEKSDILCGINNKGNLLYLADIAFRDLIVNKAEQKGLDFREISINRLGITDVIYKYEGTSFQYKDQSYFFPLLGRHQFKNLVLAIGLLEILEKEKKISQDEISFALSELHHFNNAPGRMEIQKKNGIVICDDSYNANPSSFEAAITSLAQEFSKGRLLGAFGEMTELGSHSEKEHATLARLATKHLKAVAFFSKNKKINKIFRNEWLETRIDREIFVSTNENNALEQGAYFLWQTSPKGGCILVKASRSEKIERIIRFL